MRLSQGNGIIDVRSPGEFTQGHIPGAANVALFSDEERAVIGTIYKQRNRQDAVLKGLEFVAPRLRELILLPKEKSKNNAVFVHCWRGGMRSGFVATLLEMYGLKVFTLKQGYKSFRNYTLEVLQKKYPFVVLGGRTGSGKTLLLQKLKEMGEQVIDLERLANHKGSAFGSLGEPDQPTQEQFENDFAFGLLQCDTTRPVWLEDESRMIGKKVIPPAVWEQMRSCRVFYLQLPFEKRLDYITRQYGKYDKAGLEDSIKKISRRMGPEQTKNALASLGSGDVRAAFRGCLEYYDKTYSHGLSQREQALVSEIHAEDFDEDFICKMLIEKVRAHA